MQALAYMPKIQYLCMLNQNHSNMKKTITICALAALLFVGCKSKNEPAQIQSVTFRVETFEQSTEPLHKPASVILDDEEGAPLTDIFIFDDVNQVAHQTSDAEDFGTVTIPLTHGEHTLHFIATRSTGIEVANGMLFASSLRSTFGKHLSINVTSTTEDQDITLDRLTGMLQITILDAFPANAAEIEFNIDKRHTSLRIYDFFGGDTQGSNILRTSCTSRVGLSNQVFSINCLPQLQNQQDVVTVTISAYDAQGNQIATVSVPNVTIAENTKTKLSGKLINMPVANITVNTEWEEDIIKPF